MWNLKVLSLLAVKSHVYQFLYIFWIKVPFLCQKFVFYTLLLTTIVVAAASDEITVFDVGQGNCVLVKHEKEAVLIDAGSNERQFSAIYHRLFGYDQKKHYWLEENCDCDSESSCIDTDDSFGPSFDESDGSLDEARDSMSQNPQKVTPIPMTDKGEKSSKYGEYYKTYIIDSIKKAIPKDNDDTLLLKAIVISHPDVDHYNLLPDIFSKTLFCISAVILGGQPRDYKSKLINWLNSNRKSISQVFFTGLNEGHCMFLIEDDEEDSVFLTQKRERDYAHAYCSKFKKKTYEERLIEKALKFKDDYFSISILAMNVGYKECLESNDEDKKKDEENKNTGSIVLRIERKVPDANPTSFVITGDADGCTWDFILGTGLGETDFLKTDYLLLSHHGALRHGCSRWDILQYFEPKVCFISVGNKKGYGHPQEEIITRLMALKCLRKFGTAYPISCYNGEIRRRIKCEEMICSTLDDGHISFSLIPPKDINEIHVTRMRADFINDTSGTGFKKSGAEYDFPKVPKIKKKSSRRDKETKKKAEAIREQAIKILNIDPKVNKKNKKKLKCFFKPSSDYNLILPEDDKSLDSSEDDSDQIFYLKDLNKNKICIIEKK